MQDLTVTENDRYYKIAHRKWHFSAKSECESHGFECQFHEPTYKKNATFSSRDAASQNFAKSLEENTSLLEFHFCVR